MAGMETWTWMGWSPCGDENLSSPGFWVPRTFVFRHDDDMMPDQRDHFTTSTIIHLPSSTIVLYSEFILTCYSPHHRLTNFFVFLPRLSQRLHVSRQTTHILSITAIFYHYQLPHHSYRFSLSLHRIAWLFSFLLLSPLYVIFS